MHSDDARRCRNLASRYRRLANLYATLDRTKSEIDAIKAGLGIDEATGTRERLRRERLALEAKIAR